MRKAFSSERITFSRRWRRPSCSRPSCPRSSRAAVFVSHGERAGARYNRTSPQPPVLFCFGLFWSTHKTDAFCLFCRPSLFFREAGDGEAAEGRGRLPPAWFPSEACATARGGPRKKSRKYQRSRLQQNIWSARRSEPRDLWPNAQPAPRLHRRTSFCLREQAVSTLYVPRRGSALCSTPAASWLPRSRTRPSRQRRCICSTY